MDRKSTLAALDGGIMWDVKWFAASTYLMGVSFIQIPLTLLTTVESAIRGKTVIIRLQGKKMIGAFYKQVAVLVDSSVLDKFDDRQSSAVIAEGVQ